MFDVNRFKAGSFEVTLENRAKNLGVFQTIEFQNLKNLNESDLKLFLIMGGEESKLYTFKNDNPTNDANTNQYLKLQSDSLLRIQIFSRDTSIVYSTEVGRKLHKALIQSLYEQLIIN